MKFLKHKRTLLLILFDFCIAVGVYAFVAFLAVISGSGDLRITTYILSFLACYVLILAARFLLNIYANVWRYANSKAYLFLIIADASGGAVALLLSRLVDLMNIGAWRLISFVCITNCMTLASRFVYQQMHRYENVKTGTSGTKINIAIVGAGQVGSFLAEELLYNTSAHYKPICFVDSDTEKAGGKIFGLPVLLQDDSVLEKLVSISVQEIFIAIPSLDLVHLNKLHAFFSKTGLKVKFYNAPSAEGEHDGRPKVREMKIEDLLFRNALMVTNKQTHEHYRDKVVLVTGGGGSIGSELCRGIAKSNPKRLIIFDIYENNAYDIQQELKRKYGSELDLCVEIGSVRDRKRLEAVFSYYKPEIVFHAAAHKHVPLMEHSNCEAIKNNVLGTYNTADMAEKYGAKQFTLISTDKAVNPTNVMGASKRLCEMVVQCRIDSSTVFNAVRFGNVLGSNGSVIPLFKRQIEEGGPVTITDKRIIRYFMTIPEAAGLVMQAGAMARHGELFVLDMGKPVKIIDLAENLIRISGYTPYSDIDIVETGLRPGEKLYEELLIKTEKLRKTDNDMIFVEEDTPYTRAEVDKKLEILKAAVIKAENEIAAESIVLAMKSVVPTFYSPEEINKTAQNADEMKAVRATV